jgi:tRNA pseudouridine32 synthase/23S rRNA pseudouridine746 synthase
VSVRACYSRPFDRYVRKSVRLTISCLWQVRSRLEALLAARASSDSVPSARGISLVHRLDWETSGLVVVAKTKAATACISRQFEQRSVNKVYIADVHGAPPTQRGSVNLPLSADERRLPRQQVDYAHGKHALTRWQLLDSMEVGGITRKTRLRLEPETGRRHQLRMHMLAIGCPIVGDALYTAPSSVQRTDGELTPGSQGTEATTQRNGSDRLHLHAAELGFSHPSSQQWMTFTSEPPFVL